MIKLFVIALLACAVLSACRDHHPHPYSIGDFDTRWRPHLYDIVARGYVNYDTGYRYLEKHMPDAALEKLRRSEHPLLRAVAYKLLMERRSVEHFPLLMDNLGDTAVVATDEGEWGIQFHTVSDVLLQHGRWKDSAAKAKTIEKLLLQHNRLNAAYFIVGRIPYTTTYYDAVRTMAARSFGSEAGLAQPTTNLQENAWLALARYQKKEDVALISEKIETHLGWVGTTSFEIMQAFPDDVYFKILQQYHARRFVRAYCNKENYEIPEAFIKAVAAYKTPESRDLLNAILTVKLPAWCRGSNKELRQWVLDAVWKYPCPAYADLHKRAVAYRAMNDRLYGESQALDPILPEPERESRPPDPEPIRWFY